MSGSTFDLSTGTCLPTAQIQAFVDQWDVAAKKEGVGTVIPDPFFSIANQSPEEKRIRTDEKTADEKTAQTKYERCRVIVEQF